MCDFGDIRADRQTDKDKQERLNTILHSSQKFGEDRKCDFGDICADRETNKQTNKQTNKRDWWQYPALVPRRSNKGHSSQSCTIQWTIHQMQVNIVNKRTQDQLWQVKWCQWCLKLVYVRTAPQLSSYIKQDLTWIGRQMIPGRPYLLTYLLTYFVEVI